MDSLCFLMKSQLFGEFPNLSNMNSDFTSETTVRNIEIPSSIFVILVAARWMFAPRARIQHLLRDHKYALLGAMASVLWLEKMN